MTTLAGALICQHVTSMKQFLAMIAMVTLFVLAVSTVTLADEGKGPGAKTLDKHLV